MFLDVAIYSKAANGGDVHVQFVDWIPLICNILGMIVYPPLSSTFAATPLSILSLPPLASSAAVVILEFD